MAGKLHRFIKVILLFVYFNSGASGGAAPEYIRKEGRNILNSGDYNKTVNYHIHQLNIYPDDELMLTNLATAYIYLRKYREAERTYINVLNINSENRTARAGLHNLYNMLIDRAIKSGNHNLGFDYVNKGMYYLPDNSNFYALNAQLFSAIGYHFQAGEQYKKSWEMDYQRTDNVINSWKLKRAGESYFRLGGEYSSKWIDYMENLLKKQPENRELLNLTADAYFFKNENPQKRNRLRNKAMQLYLKENPNRPNITLHFPLRGRYQISGGYFEWNLDTHNGYDGYCVDFVAIDENGRKLRDGIGLNGILSFGKDVYAAYDGVVESAVGFFNDNKIGEQNYFTSNLVTIRHEKSGYVYKTVYYHLKKDSVTVKPGQRIKKGEFIGKIGNSGFSFGPHLHFGLYDGNGVSLPLEFEELSIDNHASPAGITYKNGMTVSFE